MLDSNVKVACTLEGTNFTDWSLHEEKVFSNDFNISALACAYVRAQPVLKHQNSFNKINY